MSEESIRLIFLVSLPKLVIMLGSNQSIDPIGGTGAKERWSPCIHDEEDDAKSKYIHFDTIVVSMDYFWSPIAISSDLRRKGIIVQTSFSITGQSEVHKFQVVVTIKQNILRL